ncbi:MAG: hypothetical protein M3440_10220 [Chloroflexota bacterium]|nr:hypothetical protein [Chloroflexota bacterium]
MESALTTNMAGLGPMSGEALEKTAPELARVLSGVSSYVSERNLLGRWPFPAGGSFLFLVLRQWVQEDANETLANQMSDNEAWCKAMTMFAGRLNRPARTVVLHPESDGPRTLTMPSKSVRESIRMMQAGAADHLVNDIKSVLAQCLLPVTPATLGYALARIVGDDNIGYLPRHLQRLILRRKRDGRPFPARGVLLETHLFASLALFKGDSAAIGRNPYGWAVLPDARFHLSGDSALVTGPFIKDPLAAAMLAHRAFATSLAKHPLVDTSAIRKAQPGHKTRLGHEEDALDYVAEARHEARLKRDMLLGLDAEWKLNNALVRLLNRVRKRVAQRRKRAGQPTTPPKDWQKTARDLIDQDLDH